LAVALFEVRAQSVRFRVGLPEAAKALQGRAKASRLASRCFITGKEATR